MSTRRLPLSTNPNAVNSPLRGAATGHAALTGSKRTRSHADTQREEAYGQPPPAKRQMVSPTKSRVTVSKSLAQRAASKAAVRTDHTSQASVHKTPAEEYDNLRAWQSQTRARFPRMVFYFDSIPDDLRGRLAKLMTQYGAVSRMPSSPAPA